MNAQSLPAVRPLVISSGTIEALKWVAVLCMVIDHVNAAFYARELGTWATILGRIAMPVFSVVLAYNLARPGADLARCLRRLLLFGVLTQPAFNYVFAMVGGWWPLNILFTFAIAVGCIQLYELNRTWATLAAQALFVVGGFLAEYWWPGVALVIAAWYHFTRPQRGTAFAVALALLAVCVVNLNAWALLAVPVAAALALLDLRVPRLRWLFWWFYPLHFVAIAIAVAMTGV